MFSPLNFETPQFSLEATYWSPACGAVFYLIQKVDHNKNQKAVQQII